MSFKLLSLALIVLFFFSCNKKDDTPSKNVENSPIVAIVYDATNTLWIATDTELYKTEADGYKLMKVGLSSNINALNYELALNTLWIGTNQGLYSLDLSKDNPQAEAISIDKMSHQTIKTVYFDASEMRWFGTELGLTRNQGNAWQKDSFKQNLNGSIGNLPFENFGINSIGSVGKDYYFATDGNQLWRAKDWNNDVDAFSGASQWISPYNGSALSDTMHVVFIDSEGNQWFGGTNGIQVHKGNDPKTGNMAYFDELIDPTVYCVAENANGEIWVGTKNGISIFDGGNWTSLNTSLTNNTVTAIAFKGNNTVWVGTKKGLNKVTY